MATLIGKTALVTGASRGIGRAGALALAAAGSQVLVHWGWLTQLESSGRLAVAKEGVSLIDELAAISKRLEYDRAVVFTRPGGHATPSDARRPARADAKRSQGRARAKY